MNSCVLGDCFPLDVKQPPRRRQPLSVCRLAPQQASSLAAGRLRRPVQAYAPCLGATRVTPLRRMDQPQRSASPLARNSPCACLEFNWQVSATQKADRPLYGPLAPTRPRQPNDLCRGAPVARCRSVMAATQLAGRSAVGAPACRSRRRLCCTNLAMPSRLLPARSTTALTAYALGPSMDSEPLPGLSRPIHEGLVSLKPRRAAAAAARPRPLWWCIAPPSCRGGRCGPPVQQRCRGSCTGSRRVCGPLARCHRCCTNPRCGCRVACNIQP